MFKKISLLKNVVAVILILFMFGNVVVFANSPDESNSLRSYSDSENVIKEMVNAVSTQNWGMFTNLMSLEEQSYYIQYFADDSYTNGIKQVKTANLDSIIRLSGDLSKSDLLTREYPILLSNNNIQSFIVGIDCKVSKENKYFYNGLNYFIIALAQENGEMKIVQFNRPSYDLATKSILPVIKKDDINYNKKIAALNVIENASHGYLTNAQNEAISQGFNIINTDNVRQNEESLVQPNSYSDTPNLGTYTNYSVPWSITCLMNRTGTGAAVEIGFDYYVKNTINNEWYNSWSNESLRTGIYCIKGVGWYRTISPVSSSGGYDVTQYTQFYVPETEATNTNNMIDSMAKYYLVNKDNKLFFPEYGAGTSGTAGSQGTGRLLQWGSQYLAQQGYTYYYILNYYYKESSYSPNGEVKTVYIP
ncbi:hypothetical protein [Anaerocolumna chitinilytica]|uniref:Sporulation stage II protein D amidase enhancer LytB N-terminal domain-containing protein n=1 Tax=Anaerocolumna chitinilytica TaxID=1727145 RepID=A0A7I8DU51_9FIRM|nr:hypothetical protein [Anaerocolumna chitinilytica]BCK00762.1 hypothetical protein bsdcttw_38020 [Anaerocolumna chitinilytica]